MKPDRSHVNDKCIPKPAFRNPVIPKSLTQGCSRRNMGQPKLRKLEFRLERKPL
jgi:hypothetical protein